MWVKGRRHGGMDEPTHQTDWERWLQDQAPKFLLYARQKTRSEADAQDLVQEAVVESWQRASLDEPPPLALVFATLRRRAVDWARRNERRLNRERTALQEQADCWFDSHPEDRERTEIIEAAMRNLPQIHREVLTLKLWGGLTFAEVAVALDIPANTAASRYRYALVELRKLTKEVLA